MEENGMPAGVYVADCIQNGPAYNAGIQNGDVIVKIGEKNILSMKDYENQLEALHQGGECGSQVNAWLFQLCRMLVLSESKRERI